METVIGAVSMRHTALEGLYLLYFMTLVYTGLVVSAKGYKSLMVHLPNSELPLWRVQMSEFHNYWNNYQLVLTSVVTPLCLDMVP